MQNEIDHRLKVPKNQHFFPAPNTYVMYIEFISKIIRKYKSSLWCWTWYVCLSIGIHFYIWTKFAVVAHQFVMIETKKWIYVVAKGKGGCEIFRGTHSVKNRLRDTQKQYDSANRAFEDDPTPKVWKEDRGIFKIWFFFTSWRSPTL